MKKIAFLLVLMVASKFGFAQCHIYGTDHNGNNKVQIGVYENGVIYSSNAHDENLEQMGMIEGGHIFSTNHKGDHKKLVGVVIGNKVYATDDYKHYETLVGFIEGDAIYGCNKDGKDPHQVGTTRGGGGDCGAAAGAL